MGTLNNLKKLNKFLSEIRIFKGGLPTNMINFLILNNLAIKIKKKNLY